MIGRRCGSLQGDDDDAVVVDRNHFPAGAGAEPPRRTRIIQGSSAVVHHQPFAVGKVGTRAVDHCAGETELLGIGSATWQRAHPSIAV